LSNASQIIWNGPTDIMKLIVLTILQLCLINERIKDSDTDTFCGWWPSR